MAKFKKESLEFLEKYLNTASPTGFEQNGQQLWCDYISPFVDKVEVDYYGTAYGIINPKDFIDTVVEVRLPNPFMPDTPQRIACDTSQKLAIRFGETIKAYEKSESLKVSDLKLIPLVFAGWARYLMGIDDNLNKFELSPDPLLDKVVPMVADIKIGDTDVHSRLEKLFSDASIFGVNLYEVGLGELAEKYFVELIAGKGAVRETLKKYVG